MELFLKKTYYIFVDRLNLKLHTMRIFRTNSAVKNTKHYAFTQKISINYLLGKTSWLTACYLFLPLSASCPASPTWAWRHGWFTKTLWKTPPPSFLSGKPFKRPFGNKDKPSLIYLCFPNGLYFSDDLLKHTAANDDRNRNLTRRPFYSGLK